MTHKRGYDERMKFKNYDRDKHRKNKERYYKCVLNEKRNAEKIKDWQEELEEMKFEMEM